MSGHVSIPGHDRHLEPPERGDGCAACDDPLTYERGEGPDHYRARNGDLVHYHCEQRYVARDESEPVHTRLLALTDESAEGGELLNMRMRDGSVVRGTLCDYPTRTDPSRTWAVDDADGETVDFDPALVELLEVVDV